MANNSFIKVVRVDVDEAPHLKSNERNFFKPVSLIDGKLYSVLNDEDMPFVWGFDNLEEAQRAMYQEQNRQTCDC
jgi:hypothetical protein